MPPADADRELVEAELGRDPTRAEAALFENLWSEHCAYRSSRPLLSAFESDSDDVVIGPGDDAAVVALAVEGGQERTRRAVGTVLAPEVLEQRGLCARGLPTEFLDHDVVVAVGQAP